MKSMQVLKELGELTVSQWGMVTTAQAATRGITRLQMSRLTEEGLLERIGYGIYRDTGTPPERFDSIKAAWLSINPRLTATERLTTEPTDAIVSGATASYLLGLGDLIPEPYEFTVRTRRQTQRNEVRFHIRALPAENLTRREGLPVTTPEQTIADLMEARMDISLVANVLSDTDALDPTKLVKLLSPLAARNGFKRGDGHAVYTELERLAHRDIDSLAKAVSSTSLAKKITEEYLKTINPESLSAMTSIIETFKEIAGEMSDPQTTLDHRVRKQLMKVAEHARRNT